MITRADVRRGLALRSYLAASHAIAPLARPFLQRRLRRGKEDPHRWQEKLGLSTGQRPDGPLVWLHAVGLGEVLSLRGLITRMAAARDDLQFLVTSSTRASADVFAKAAPPRTIHQFLPLDAPRFRRRFLDHFRPDLCIWAEQDLWPGFVSELHRRAVPQAVVAARMNAESFRKHRKIASLYRNLYSMMDIVTAQDAMTADHLRQLGAGAEVTGSLKPAAPSLPVDPSALQDLQDTLAGRVTWAVAPAHAEDAQLAQDAHEIVRKTDPNALLIIAPRFPDRWLDRSLPRRTQQALPLPDDPVWLCDTFGELGLVYRVTQAVLIGGTFGDIEGHNPWEAAILDNALLHGSRTANFRSDFETLQAAQASARVSSAADIAAVLLSGKVKSLSQTAAGCVADAAMATDALVDQLLPLLDHAK